MSERTVRHGGPTSEPDDGGGRGDATDPGALRFPVGSALAGLGADVGLPLVVYYGLHAAGVGDVTALLAGAAAAAARLGWVARRERRLNPFAAALLAAFGLGSVLVLISGDARILLLKGSVTTGAIGLVFLATAGGRRPLTLAAEQSWHPRRAAAIGAEFAADPDVRRGHRVSSRVWGAGLLAEAAVRAVLVYLLPVSVMVGLSTGMIVATVAGLAVWNARYVCRAQGRPPGVTGPGV